MTALVHQGTCYSATAAMVPVLAGLATSTALPARRRLDLHRALLRNGLKHPTCQFASRVRTFSWPARSGSPTTTSCEGLCRRGAA